MKKLKYQKLNKENFSIVLDIKHKLFPESVSDEDYEKYFNNQIKSNYYLITIDNLPCATIGWYDFDNKNKTAFVGWFGVLPEFQNMGIGKQILSFIITFNSYMYIYR